MAKGLHLYIDFLSQPSRAIYTFVKATSIVAEIHAVDLFKREHLTDEYKVINPMGQVPAIIDDDFKLFESHAILRYLATTRGVPDNWYPSEAKQRATVDCILDWHHANLRRGSAGLVLAELLGPKFLGHPKDEKAIAEAENKLHSSLSFIEKVWLAGDSVFLAGFSKPSIADLSLACEIKQLELLGDKNSSLLAPYEKVVKWLAAVEEATSPHFGEAHAALYKLAENIQ